MVVTITLHFLFGKHHGHVDAIPSSTPTSTSELLRLFIVLAELPQTRRVPEAY